MSQIEIKASWSGLGEISNEPCVRVSRACGAAERTFSHYAPSRNATPLSKLQVAESSRSGSEWKSA